MRYAWVIQQIAQALDGVTVGGRFLSWKIRFSHRGLPASITMPASALNGAERQGHLRLKVRLQSDAATHPFSIRSPEDWSARVRRRLGLSDVIVGAAEFDAWFLICAERPVWLAAVLNARRREELLDWARIEPFGKLEVEVTRRTGRLRFCAERALALRPELVISFVGSMLALLDYATGYDRRGDLLRGAQGRLVPTAPTRRALDAPDEWIS